MQCSIIIPTLNEASCISRTLAPLQSLRQQGHEVILVDAGSQDQTITLAKSSVDQIIQPSVPGRAKQMNAGALQATGEVLVFLHADTLLQSDSLDVLQTVLRSTGKVWGRFDVLLDSRKPVFRLIETLINWRSRLSGIATGDQVMFVRTDTFRQTGCFPDQPLMEDIELSRRLKKISRPACISKRVVTSSRRWEQNGVIRTVILMWWLRLAYFFGASPEQLVKMYYARV